MDWQTAGEIVRDLAPLGTATAAACAAWIAYRGLEKWRVEAIGKRKAELAEVVLADFYRAQNVFRWARSGVIFSGELTTAPDQSNENASAERSKEILTLPLKRLADESELFARLASHRYRFQALFGEKSAAPFDKIASVCNELSTCIGILGTLEGWNSFHRDERSNEQIMNLRGKIWNSGPEDKIGNAINLAVAEIERICRPALSSKSI